MRRVNLASLTARDGGAGEDGGRKKRRGCHFVRFGWQKDSRNHNSGIFAIQNTHNVLMVIGQNDLSSQM